MDTFEIDINSLASTLHYGDEAHMRRRDAIDRAGGVGEPICGVYWDKGHRNGPEVHILTTTAVILVVNHRTRMLVTSKLARPGQIEQLYGRDDIMNGRVFDRSCVPQSVLDRAFYYVSHGYNEM